MPRDNEKGGGNGNGDKKSKWDTADWKILRGIVLYFLNKSWFQNVYDAAVTNLKFRVVVDGKVISGVPKASPGTHNNTHNVLWGNNDVDWDDQGCLIIKDKKLGDRVLEAHENGVLHISAEGPPGPIGENKVNAMCPC